LHILIKDNSFLYKLITSRETVLAIHEIFISPILLEPGLHQGVWNMKEIETTWSALAYHYTCFADGTSFE